MSKSCGKCSNGKDLKDGCIRCMSAVKGFIFCKADEPKHVCSKFNSKK